MNEIQKANHSNAYEDKIPIIKHIDYGLIKNITINIIIWDFTNN